MLFTVIIFLLVLGLLVFVHEFGHFVVAKKSGVKVEEFGFGFPPRMFGIKRGGTIYSVNWLPLGGFVRMKGEQGTEKGAPDKDSFVSKPAWKRSLILSAGVVMNFVLAAVLLSIGFMYGMPQVTDDLRPSASVRDKSIRIVAVMPGSPADEAGILPGDKVVSMDSRAVVTVDELKSYLGSQDRVVALALERGDESLSVEVQPTELENYDGKGIGVGLIKMGLVSYPPHRAVWEGTRASVLLTGRIIQAFVGIIGDLVSARQVSMEVAGPVGIAVLAGQMSRLGPAYLMQFAAVLSLNLAVLNFIPWPALDGGRLLFLGIEKVRRKPVDRRIEAVIHNIGFILLIVLVLLVTVADVRNFGPGILDSLRSMLG